MILGQSITIADNGGHYVPRTQATANAESFMASLRVNQQTGLIDPAWMIKAMQSAETRGTAENELYWLSMGPDNMGGQTTAVLYDNKLNPDTGGTNGVVYIGSMGGGVYKTYNYGVTWHQVGNQDLMVSCMTQDPEGNIYVGTGDGNAAATYNGLSQQSYDNSFVGSGIWMIDANDGMTQLTSTIPSINEAEAWSFVNDLAYFEGKLIAATEEGLKYSTDKGQTWNFAKYVDENDESQPLDGVAAEVKIGSNIIVASVDGKIYIGNNIDKLDCHSSDGAMQGDTLIPAASGLLDVAIAPGNDNVIYAACINSNDGTHTGFYLSIDKGNTWRVILPSISINFGHNVYEKYGLYNHGIVVDPTNEKVIYVLGYNLWKLFDAGENGGFYICSQLTDGSASVYYSSDYLHVGIQSMTFNPNNSNECYVGTDGGIYKATRANGTFSFSNCNRNYMTTRMFNVGVSGTDRRIMAAGLSHGTVMIEGNVNQNTECYGYWINPTGYNEGAFDEAGQAGPCAFSAINANTIFVTYKDGGLRRSETAGEDWVSNNFVSALTGDETDHTLSTSSYRLPILLHETYNDNNNLETVWYHNRTDNAIPAGTAVQCMSNNDYPFDYTLTAPLAAGDSIEVHDPITSRLFMSYTNVVYMTRMPLQFASEAQWYLIANKKNSGFEGEPLSMAISADGDNLWVGTKAGRLYRLANVNTVIDDESGTITDTTGAFQVETTLMELPVSGQCVTSIAVDPRNANKVVVTLGNYGNDAYVLYSNNAMSENPTFTSKQANLPKMPVYSSLIEMTNGQVILGTERGIYTTNNIENPNWVFDGEAMGEVPVMELKQQLLHRDDAYEVLISENDTVVNVYPGVHNTGIIYAATYGRGMFRCENYKQYSGTNVPEISTVTETNVGLYPNPVREQAIVSFEVSNDANVSYQVFDMMGRMVMSQNMGRYAQGTHEVNVNMSDLSSGSYIMRLNAGGASSSVKFIVY